MRLVDLSQDCLLECSSNLQSFSLTEVSIGKQLEGIVDGLETSGQFGKDGDVRQRRSCLQISK